MTEIRGVLSGTHPFSEQLIQQIIDYKYGRANSSAVKNLFHKELTDLLLLQKEHDFPVTSNGSFGVEDLIRPFTRSLDSVHSYKELNDLPIDRWHYTNTFYRKPELVKKFPDIPNVIKDDIHSWMLFDPKPEWTTEEIKNKMSNKPYNHKPTNISKSIKKLIEDNAIIKVRRGVYSLGIK